MSLLIAKPSLLENVAEKLSLYTSAPPKKYGLPKINKEDITFSSVVNTTGALIYSSAEYLMGLQ
jgi:hypothetical protein